MATDNDIKKDYEECYAAGSQHWGPAWEEMKTDLKFRQGDQWKSKDKRYLESQDREAMVFNKTHRIVNVVAGYEQKNLLALKIDPFEGGDETTANQFSAIVLNNMMYGGGYMAMSGAFEFGAVTTGMNLVEPWIDRSDDILNGDIRFRRLPYNRFILDPTFNDRDLDRDCGFVITRDYFNKDQCKALMPDRYDDIQSIKGSGNDGKFGQFYPQKGKNNEYNLKYDRFYTQVNRPYTVLADMKTGQIMPVPDDPKAFMAAQMFIARFPDLRMLRGSRKGVDLHIFIEGELMYSGLDSSGLDEYPFVLEAGYFTPEEDDPKYRMQGIVRCLRDPGTEANRRRSMIIDMLDGVIRSGWKFKEGSVVNEEALYASGFENIVMDKNAQMTDAERHQQITIPQGLFQASDMMDKDHDSISGVNQEMLGDPNNDNIEVAAVLAKLRSANGLVTLQSLFNNHRFAKTLIGRKQIKMIQKNYLPAKIQRITGETPTKEFYTRDFAKYDCVPVEGVLTDSQRQMYFAQISAWKKAGAPIPWSEIIEYAPLEKKESLKKALIQAEKGQSAQSQQDMMTQQITNQLLQSEKAHNIAMSKEKLAQIEENRAGARLDNAKAMKELRGMDIDNFLKTLDTIKIMMESLRQPEQPMQGNMLTNSGQNALIGNA
jgi:hypothetical protein